MATILVGRNIGNEYFDANPTLEFADLDVLAIGGVVKDVIPNHPCINVDLHRFVIGYVYYPRGNI